ncbi:MAG: TIGR02147 family protein [Pseudobdellovibrionaceae bacterium]
MIEPISHFSFLLKEELEKRKSQKKMYSLNAFARDLGISKAFLSQVLKGKKNLSEKTASRMILKLKWASKKKKLFLDLVRYQLVKGESMAPLLAEDIRKQTLSPQFLNNLNIEKFNFISKWYHFAILELCEISDFQFDPGWISKNISISKKAAIEAIARMKNLGVIKIENGILKKTQDNVIKDIPSRAIQEYHREHLGLARKSLQHISPEFRNFTGTTMSINLEQLKKVTELIEDFHNQVADTLEVGPKTHVYHLAVQLYPLSQLQAFHEKETKKATEKTTGKRPLSRKPKN